MEVRVTAFFVLNNGTVDYGNVTRTLQNGEGANLLSFERPCEKRLVGDLVLRADLDNGTGVTYREHWDAGGCGPQDCRLGLAADGAVFDCYYRD